MKSKSINFIFVVFTFLQVIFIRFSTHHFETLDWDINAFLVTSLEFGRGNLPYEFQYENKPPLLFLIFYLYSLLTNNNLFFIKIINDILLFLILIVMSNLYKDKNSNSFTKYIPPIIFLLLTSNVWFHPSYSEYLVIFFLAITQYLVLRKNNKYKYILIGLMLGFASLINLGSVIFLFSFLLIINLNYGVNLNRNIKIFIGFFIPHIVFILIYSVNNLFNEYYMAIIEIPLSYIRTDFSFSRALTVFLVALKNFNLYIYLILLICFALLIFRIFNNTLSQIKERSVIELAVLNITSLLFFYFAGKGYYHHLLLFLYFMSFSTKWITKKIDRKILIMLIFISLNFVNQKSYDMTIINLRNFKNIQSSYPIYQISNKVKNEISKNDLIFSTNNILILYYLNKQNSSYIVHPALYSYAEITNVLEKNSKINKDEIFYNIAKKPKILELNSKENSINGYKKIITDDLNITLLNYWSKNPNINMHIKK